MILVTYSGVEVSLNVSISQVSVDEPLYVIDKGKVLYLCITMVNMLLELLDVLKTHSLYAWVSTLQSDTLVLMGRAR